MDGAWSRKTDPDTFEPHFFHARDELLSNERPVADDREAVIYPFGKRGKTRKRNAKRS